MPIFSDIASMVALIVSVLAIVTFIVARRKTAIEEGKHIQTVEQLQKDLERAYAKIRLLEDVSHERDVMTGEIKADVKHLLEAVKRIEAKLDGHIIGMPT